MNAPMPNATTSRVHGTLRGTMTFEEMFNAAKDAAKTLNLDKIKTGVSMAQDGLQIASAAMQKPELALAGLLKTFARRAMDEELTDDEAKTLAGMVVKAIRKKRER